MRALESRLKDQARAAGFALVGIARAGPADDFARLREWLDRGYAGEMAYLPRHADARHHPASILPERGPDLMNTGERLVLEPRDLVLHEQLAALELGDLEIVGRRMRKRFGDLRLERPVPFLQFRKLHLSGHGRVLLVRLRA